MSDDIPLMIGGTREESALFLADDDAVWNGNLSEAELHRRIAALAGDRTDELLTAYHTAIPPPPAVPHLPKPRRRYAKSAKHAVSAGLPEKMVLA
jgi:hypothetical protein